MKTYEVTNDRNEIVIRFDRRLVDREALSRLLDYVETESIRQRSQMTEEEARALADDVDQAVWEKVKHEYAAEGEKCAPHVALTLELNGELWTGDKTLKAGLREQGFDAFFEPPKR